MTLPADAVSGDKNFVDLNYPAAIESYDKALVASPENPDVLWRLARAYVCLADVSPDSLREPRYRKAERFARRCIERDSLNASGHTWLGASLGCLAMYEGSKARVRLCTTIKQELERAIELNPQDDIAYSILGTFYRVLGSISWIEKRLATIFLGSLPSGGYEESEQMFKKAIELSPSSIRHRYEMGLLYQVWGRKENAKILFKSALGLHIQIATDSLRLKDIKEWLN
jgi:tetratricopeptide (TPR) repeat protein